MQKSLRIVPHPDARQRMFKSKQVTNAQGLITRPAGTPMFRYVVEGGAQELAAFRVAAGQYLIQDENPTITDPITGEVTENPCFGFMYMNSQQQFFTPRNLIITRDGRVAIEDDPFEIRLQTTLKKASAFGKLVENQAAQHVANILFADLYREPVTTSVIQPQVQPHLQPEPQSPSPFEAIDGQ
jgi:hypothetical protein